MEPVTNGTIAGYVFFSLCVIAAVLLRISISLQQIAVALEILSKK